MSKVMTVGLASDGESMTNHAVGCPYDCIDSSCPCNNECICSYPHNLGRVLTMEDEYEEAPETIIVFAREDEEGHVESVVDEPPLAEELTYYKAYRIRKDVWDEFQIATKDLEDAKKQAEKTLAIHRDTFNNLIQALVR